jgi:hypothetical protein
VGLSDIAGIFSRFFIVGFFIPVFFALVALSQMATASLLPNAYEQYESGATRILILGAGALVVGLLLLGLHYNVVRLFEGYPLMRRGLGMVYRPLRWLQGRSYENSCAGKRKRARKQTRRRSGSA